MAAGVKPPPVPIRLDGTLTPIAQPAVVEDCGEVLPPNWRAPGFRGPEVETNGTVCAAATGCRRVVKTSAQSAVKPV
jgi:hypothetical protein